MPLLETGPAAQPGDPPRSLPRSGQAQARRHQPGHHGRGRRARRPPSPRTCASAGWTRSRSPTSSTASSSASSPRTLTCCRTSFSAACREGARPARAVRQDGRPAFRRDGRRWRLRHGHHPPLQRQPVRPGAVLELTDDEIESVYPPRSWIGRAVDPSIFGTLFERGMDPGKRAQIGAHYTSREDIETLVEPVVMWPLRREWDEVAADGREPADHRPQGCQAGRPRPSTRPSATKARGRVREPGPPLPREAARERQGARPGLRLRQLPLRDPAEAEGPGEGRHRLRAGEGIGRCCRWWGRGSSTASRSAPMPTTWRRWRSGSAISSGCGATASDRPRPDPASDAATSSARTRSWT